MSEGEPLDCQAIIERRVVNSATLKESVSPTGSLSGNPRISSTDVFVEAILRCEDCPLFKKLGPYIGNEEELDRSIKASAEQALFSSCKARGEFLDNKITTLSESK